MKKLDLKSALVGALLTALIALSVAAAAEGPARWEYKVVTGRAFGDELSKAINGSAANGWEFVSASGPNNENWGIAILRRERN